MHSLKDLKDLLKIMPEETDDDIKNKLLISLYILQSPLNISFSNMVLYLKKPVIDVGNYFVIRNKSWVLHNNSTSPKTTVKYNNKWNREIYLLLSLSYKIHPRMYLFVKKKQLMNDDDIERLFFKLTKVKIQDLPKTITYDFVNSARYKIMSSQQKDEEYKKIGCKVDDEYKKIIVTF
jgi:hypothetical protein